MAVTKLSTSTPLVLLGQQTGITVIPAQTPLTRLNYFDGKFLRAQDLQAEQNYLRQLTQLSNQANGFGVVNGFNVELAGGDRLSLSAGLAIDPRGRVLLLGQEQLMSIQELIDKSRNLVKLLQSSTLHSTGGFAECTNVSEAPPTNAAAGRDWYLLTLAHAEALCGEEDVYGKLCEEACVTSTDRPYRLEGVVVRALPLVLTTPLAESAAVQLNRTHLRSLIASAYYSDEAKRVGSLISGAGLKSDAWCVGAIGLTGNEVPIGVLVRDGNSTLFVDEWIARRELIETSPRRYWQWRMAMRPWDVYLAQICQFQCQLHSRLEDGVDTAADDPCAEAKRLVDEAATHFKVLAGYYKQTTAKLQKMSKSVREKLLEDSPDYFQTGGQYAAFEARLLQATQAFKLLPADRLLIRSGIVETPSAGYLPVVPGDTITVNEQVRRMMGEGVDLRFCIVRPDFIPHALEEAQHMERISLLRGLDNPNDKPKVDVLVPNGKIAADRTETGRYYEMRMNIIPENLELLALAVQYAMVRGASDTKVLSDDGTGASKAADAATILRKFAALIVRDDRKNPQTFEYSGAAHADAGQQGALSFYYAGITRPTAIAVAKPQEIGTTPGLVNSDGMAIHTNLNALSTGSAGGDYVSEAMMNRMLNLNSRLAAGLQRDVETRSSIWASMELAQDPTALARGKSVAVKAEAVLEFTMQLQLNEQRLIESANTGANAVAPTKATIATVLRAGFVGEFTVDDIDVKTGATEIRDAKGTVSGELTLSIRTGGVSANQNQQTFSFYLSEPVRVQRAMGSSGPLVKILAADWSIFNPLLSDVEVEREWKAAQRAEVLGVMHFRAPQQTANALLSNMNTSAMALKEVSRQAFHAWQTVNPKVSEPQHPAHEDAIRALRTIGTALGSSKFADLAAQKLFPAPKPASSDLNVLATLDWVMFHRRREKNCQQETPVLPLETRQYALYHLQATGDLTLADIRKQLERTAANAKLPELDFVQLVEFGAGIHAVISSHPQLQASWRQDVGVDAGKIVGGFIASHGVAASEGVRLAQERLESLGDVIAAVTPEELNPDYQVLNRVPDALDTPSNDGVIIVVTRAAIVSNCHTVIAVERAQDLARLVRAAQAGGFNQALASDKLAKNLGTVNFAAATPDATQLQSVLQAWSALDYKPANGAAVITNASDQAAAGYTPQSTALLAAFGGTGASQAVSTPETLSGCPAVTIVAGSVVYRNVLYIYGNWDRAGAGQGQHFLQPTAPNSPGEFRNNVEQGDALENFIAGLTANQPVRGVTLATTQAAPDAGAATRLQAVLQALTAAGTPIPAATRQVVEALNDHDRAELIRIGKDPNAVDEVIFFELNSGV